MLRQKSENGTAKISVISHLSRLEQCTFTDENLDVFYMLIALPGVLNREFGSGRCKCAGDFHGWSTHAIGPCLSVHHRCRRRLQKDGMSGYWGHLCCKRTVPATYVLEKAAQFDQLVASLATHTTEILSVRSTNHMQHSVHAINRYQKYAVLTKQRDRHTWKCSITVSSMIIHIYIDNTTSIIRGVGGGQVRF